MEKIESVSSRRLQLILLLSAVVIALPSLMSPVNAYAATVVEKNHDYYYFRVHGIGAQSGDAGVWFTLKNLSPDSVYVIVTCWGLDLEGNWRELGGNFLDLGVGQQGDRNAFPKFVNAFYFDQEIQVNVLLTYYSEPEVVSETMEFSVDIRIPP